MEHRHFDRYLSKHPQHPLLKRLRLATPFRPILNLEVELPSGAGH